MTNNEAANNKGTGALFIVATYRKFRGYYFEGNQNT